MGKFTRFHQRAVFSCFITTCVKIISVRMKFAQCISAAVVVFSLMAFVSDGTVITIAALPFLVPTTIGFSNLALGLLGASALIKAKLIAGGALRAKRSTANANYIDAISSMVDVQAALDEQTSCGSKIVCELSARWNAGEDLPEEEKLILALFGSEQGTLRYIKSKSKEIYHTAFLLGQDGGVEQCVATFDRCPVSSHDIFDQLRQFK